MKGNLVPAKHYLPNTIDIANLNVTVFIVYIFNLFKIVWPYDFARTINIRDLHLLLFFYYFKYHCN